MRLALAQTSAELRASVRGRYVATDALHVTLAFLGQVPAADVPALCTIADRACSGVAPIEARLGGFGSFGRHSAAVLWQGFDGAPFDKLAAAVRTGLEAEGFDYDGANSFLAHVTLMRKADVRAGILPTPQTASGTVTRVSLFSSELGEDRARYTALHTCTLSGRSLG